MVFWEACFQRTYHAFTTRNYFYRAHMVWWIADAERHNLLKYDNLSTLSLCAIKRVVGSSTSCGRRAVEILSTTPSAEKRILEFERRDHSGAIAGLVWDRDDPHRCEVGLDGVFGLYYQSLAAYVSRILLVDAKKAGELASHAIGMAYLTWHPFSQLTFEADMLVRLDKGIRAAALEEPDTFPSKRPAWFNGLGEDEKGFLLIAFGELHCLERKILFLTVFAGMIPAVIAPAMSGGVWEPVIVEQKLRNAWGQILPKL